MTLTWSRVVVFLLAVSSSVVTAGCEEKSKEKQVFKVYGKLTSEGKPMARAEITFLSADPAQRNLQSRATADANGEYALYTYRPGDGAPVGEYVVTIYWPAPLTKKQADKLEKAETVEEKETIVAPDLLKNAYNHPLKSPLKATVEPKDNEINFKLP